MNEKVSISSALKRLSDKEFNLSDIFRYLNIVLIVIAILTFFLPFARFQMPVMGSQSISGFSLLLNSLTSQKENVQNTANQSFNKIDVKALNNIATGGNENNKVLDQKTSYKFIPIGLDCGLFAYLSLIIIALEVLAKKPLLSFITSVFSFVFSISFMTSFFLINDLVHFQMNSSMKELEGNPFAGLATMFTQGIKIEPAIAIYLLIFTTFFIGIFSWLENKIER